MRNNYESDCRNRLVLVSTVFQYADNLNSGTLAPPLPPSPLVKSIFQCLGKHFFHHSLNGILTLCVFLSASLSKEQGKYGIYPLEHHEKEPFTVFAN